jgi:hypothetical protein
MVYVAASGTTSYIIEFEVYDSSSTTGALLAGLAYNTGSLVAYYDIWGAAGGATAISLKTMTKGTWASEGFVAVDGTNMAGRYQLGVPNACLAAGASGVTIRLGGAANMVSVTLHICLIASPADVAALVTPASASDLDAAFNRNID